MLLVDLIVALVVVGVVLYLINSFVPMDANVKKLLNVAVILFLVLWMLRAVGLWTSLGQYRLG